MDEDYTHDLIVLPKTPGEIEFARLQKLEAEQKKLEMEKTSSKKKVARTNSEIAEEAKQEEEGVDYEDFLYRTYFKNEELERVAEAQGRRVFDDLMSLREDAVKAAIQSNLISKFDIEMFSPDAQTKRVVTIAPLGKQNKHRKDTVSQESDLELLADANSKLNADGTINAARKASKLDVASRLQDHLDETQRVAEQIK